MSKLKSFPIILLVLVLIGFSYWRQSAPSWNGQDLHPRLETGDNFEILLVGDMGSGDEHQISIAEAMNSYCQTHKLSAIIFLGDNFYPKGVESPEDPQWQSKFITPYNRDCIGKVPYYALLGNHDYKGNPAAEINYHGKTPAWNMPHRFYDIRFGKQLQLTMIDSNIMDICGFNQYCTIDFMLDSLAKTDAPNRIVLGHHPITSSSGKYSRTLQGMLLEKVLCGKAQTYISGHSHHLEHLTSANCPLDLFVVGGGGADLYEVKKWQKETLFAESSFGFMSLKVSPVSLKFAFFDSKLKQLYEVERKSGENKDPAPAQPLP
ncbi:MAG: metallophosphoesterase [Oligoflexus sp.]|nr:metallophosphoesterase [Oligoflexus sp.]